MWQEIWLSENILKRCAFVPIRKVKQDKLEDRFKPGGQKEMLSILADQ